jgi:hypothetical protein
LTLAFLPHDAWVNLDAIGRALVRMLWTRRGLLEWQTASDAERTAGTTVAGFFRMMWVAPAVGLASAAGLLAGRPETFAGSGALVVLWIGAPVLAWWISQPITTPVPDLLPEQRAFLRRKARQTWGFFETFVTATDHNLMPDNFQEVPQPVIARRTSPTNLGFALLANLAAHDFGYLGFRGLLERVRPWWTPWSVSTVTTGISSTGTTPGPAARCPLYVSTVDSGIFRSAPHAQRRLRSLPDPAVDRARF